MSLPKTLPASTGAALLVTKGQTLKITNTHGRQVVDFWALNPADPAAEYLSMSHNHAIHRRLRLGVGDTLYSSTSRPILSWVEDSSSDGDHDTLISACNPRRYERMGVRGWHASCTENYLTALAGASSVISQDGKGVFPITAPTPLNLFMNVKVDGEGGIVFRAPTSKAGDHVAFEALMDVVVVLSACPMDQRASEDWLPSPKEVQYAVMEG